MKSLGSGSTIASTALTIKQFADLHGHVPQSLLVNLVFKPGKYDAWGIICNDEIKFSIPKNNPLYEFFTTVFLRSENFYTPYMVVFDQDNIGSYEVFDASDDFRVTDFSPVKDFGWKFKVEPINHSDNTGINPDAKRKNAAPKSPPKTGK